MFAKHRAEIEQFTREQKEAQKRKDESLVRILAVKIGQLQERATEFRQQKCLLNGALTFLQANEVGGEDDLDETFLDDF